ncbi:unnamed protein product [Brachionus calyciflorus]|uniref:G-protein coupled receptors family 1 profile domain-containing protein n=1 Tax=Brachionus calyciflorus TaxID=104777 RepID=A0A813WGL8_9BILA|nr:unnamed protein product [Brachionus calyciflorus]
MAEINLNKETTLALQIVIPVIYVVLALLGIIGNLIVLQIICANRFRHKSIHLLISSILFADFFYIIIFTIIRVVSFASANTTWFINPSQWCKAESYLLQLFDFILAYTIVFMCLDRAVRSDTCWFSIRKFRSGISIVISIWIASAYVLIPFLLFDHSLFSQTNGGYVCSTSSLRVTENSLFTHRTLDFIYIIFRIFFPIFLMIFLLIIASINLYKSNLEKQKAKTAKSYLTGSSYPPINDGLNKNMLLETTVINKDDLSLFSSTYNKKIFSMVLLYAILFIFCQLPYEIYRCVLLWHREIESKLFLEKLDFAIEIPLLILKLLNRCVNPFFFICLGDIYKYRLKCCRLWCLPCLPGCIGCKNCWCYDCWGSMCYEINHCLGKRASVNSDDYVPTGLQTISTYQYRDGDRLVTKQKIIEEYETGVEPYYKNPQLKERIQEARAFDNETFEIDDLRLQTLNAEEKLRAKL